MPKKPNHGTTDSNHKGEAESDTDPGVFLVWVWVVVGHTWNLAALGYMPQKLVLGTAVYSLGLVGGLKAMFKSFTRGEVSDLTSLIYEAHEHAIGLIKAEAQSIGADDVVGIRTHIHDMAGVIEFMAIGTAVKKLPGARPKSDQLPPQAIIKDRDTWITFDPFAFAMVGANTGDDT